MDKTIINPASFLVLIHFPLLSLLSPRSSAEPLQVLGASGGDHRLNAKIHQGGGSIGEGFFLRVAAAGGLHCNAPRFQQPGIPARLGGIRSNPVPSSGDSSQLWARGELL